jgi:hypothetical protein
MPRSPIAQGNRCSSSCTARCSAASSTRRVSVDARRRSEPCGGRQDRGRIDAAARGAGTRWLWAMPRVRWRRRAHLVRWSLGSSIAWFEARRGDANRTVAPMTGVLRMAVLGANPQLVRRSTKETLRKYGSSIVPNWSDHQANGGGGSGAMNDTARGVGGGGCAGSSSPWQLSRCLPQHAAMTTGATTGVGDDR